MFCGYILQTTSLKAAGVVLTKQTPSESEAYWKVIEFSSIEHFPTSVVITTTSKQTSSIPRHQIGEVIEFVDFNATSIVTEEQLSKLKTARESVVLHASRCKQAANILTTVAAGYDQVLQSHAKGNVLVAGKWLKRADYEAQQNADRMAATAGTVPEITAGTKTFKNVRVTKVEGDRISIMHDGGIAALNVKEISDATLKKLEGAFPKQFFKEEKNTSTEPAKSPLAENKTPKLPWEPEQNTSPTTTESGKTSSIQRPLPLPGSDGLGLTVQAGRKRAPLDKKILEKEKPDILEAVSSIKKRLSLSKYNGGQDIMFGFDLETGRMSVGDQMAMFTKRRVYILMVGDLDPGRIETGTYRENYETVHYVQAFTTNDAKTIEGIDSMASHLERNLILLAEDDVDAERNGKALHYLASIYRSNDLSLPDKPLDRLNALLTKDEEGDIAAELDGDTLVLSGRGKGSRISTTTRVHLRDLDPEKFRYLNSGEQSSNVELFCATGKTAVFIEDTNGQVLKGTTTTMSFPVLNVGVARQIIEIITQMCIDAGWRKQKF